MPSRSRNKMPNMLVDLRKSHFRSKNREVCEKVVNILREMGGDKTKPWSEHSLISVSSLEYPFYQTRGGGVYYTSGVLDKTYKTRIDADLFLNAYNKGKVTFV